MTDSVIALRDRVAITRSGEYVYADLNHDGTVYTLKQHVGSAPMDQTVKTVSGILAVRLAADVWNMLLSSMTDIRHDNHDTEGGSETDMAQSKWLTPKRSKDAKTHGESHGHKFGRLSVKEDTATAKCKNDRCAVTLHVTENHHELVPDENGVISCVTSGAEPTTKGYDIVVDEATADQILMEYESGEHAGRVTVTKNNDGSLSFTPVNANDMLMGSDTQQVPVEDSKTPGDDDPFALELPPAPQAPREITFANGETWNPERDLIDTISDAIINHPRSQQQLIGPSEIGTKCTRCLAKKLMGVPQTRDTAWLPQVGTAVHDWLDETLSMCESCGWLTERQVTVGIIGNRVIRGRCDAFKNGVVVDFKIVGANTLKTVRASGPTPVYRVQDHLYGRGYELDGFEVTHVALLYLPRNSPTLADAELHLEPYDRGIALRALERAEKIQKFVQADPSNVLQLPRDPDCYDCSRYAPLPGEDAPSVGPRAGNPFAGIL